MSKPEIYDGFIFFNELDLLDIRFHELDPYVDHFVLVESTLTFTGKPKPLYYWNNRHLFEPFNHKVIHIVVSHFPNPDMSPWDREKFQRNMISQGFIRCKQDDIIMISDVDEIPRGSGILEYLKDPGIRCFLHGAYYYMLNVWCDYRMYLTRIMRYNEFRRFQDIQEARHFNSSDRAIVGGWHWSYLGDVKSIQDKIDAFAHQEFNKPEFTNPDHIQDAIVNVKDLFGRTGGAFNWMVVDVTREAYPQFITENIERFRHLIKDPDQRIKL